MNWDEFIKDTSSESKDIPILISFEEWENVMQYLRVIAYIAGYCVFSASKKLKCEECRKRLTSIEAEELNLFIFKESCKNNYDSLRLAKSILWASTNTLLNNLCFKYNDKLVQEKRTKRRKLQTVS